MAILTINFIFKRSVWVKHTYCMDKLSKFNNRIFLFIKKIKNLQAQEKGKLKCGILNKRKIKLVEWNGRELQK